MSTQFGTVTQCSVEPTVPKCAYKIPKFITNSAKVHQKFDKKVLGRWPIISVPKIGGRCRYRLLKKIGICLNNPLSVDPWVS